jgi:type II secretory pathway pseudopilin PulG
LARRRAPTGPSSKAVSRVRARRTAGFSTIETLFTVAVMATVGGIAIPPLRAAAEDLRASGAARYLATRLQRARMEAVMRSANVAVRFIAATPGYAFAVYVDGNGNGVLASDIQTGVDTRLGSIEQLSDNFAGVEFATLAGLPPVDAGGTPPGDNPIRLGSSRSASFTPSGTSSTGTVYVKGAGNRQFAIRIYGDTGKTRILRFDVRSRVWKSP